MRIINQDILDTMKLIEVNSKALSKKFLDVARVIL